MIEAANDNTKKACNLGPAAVMADDSDAQTTTVGLPVHALAPQIEKHTHNSGYVRDAIIGLADGLTVPFALTAGLSSVGSAKLVILGGLAELFAGSISMGLGAYLAATTERRHYEVELARERRQVTTCADQEEEIMVGMFADYGIGVDDIRPLTWKLRNNLEGWAQFMMDFELKLDRPGKSKPWLSALVMGLAYLLGGLIPMIPYFAISTINTALFVSIGITAVMLLVFGYVKAIATGETSRRMGVWGALETLLIGATAAGVSYGIVKGVDSAFHING